VRGKRFFLAGLACAILATAALLWTQRRPGETLDAHNLQAAMTLWTRAGPEDYDLEVVVRGTQEGDHEIEVRGGKVVKMTTGGAPASPSAYAYWTVEGMFRFLSEELDYAKRHQDEGETVLTVAYDKTYGYPARFVRHVMGQSASIEWEVTSFRRK